MALGSLETAFEPPREKVKKPVIGLSARKPAAIIDVMLCCKGSYPLLALRKKNFHQLPTKSALWPRRPVRCMYYNFCRVHQTLRVTPAIEAGVADHIWTIQEVVALLDSN